MPNETRVHTATSESSPWIDDPIAITGIGLRLPGSVRTPQQYWDFLTQKGSGRCRVPANRYNVDAFLGPKGKPGHTCTEFGYFLDDVDLAAADSSFWSMKPKELELLDPQQRLMQEVIYECLESSGAAAYSGKDIGCYVGVLGEDWMEIQTKDPQHLGVHSVAGYGDFAIANRVSKELGLTGPSMTIRTACSSSMMALHTACQSIYSGECSSAIVGGCSLILSPRMTVAMASEYRVISPTGYCRSFDATADGYARGEAVNAIHIKRLSHALRDGDPIRAVIRSVCLNSDGQRTPLLVPSPESHELLMRRSHQLAGITDLSQTAMIECHGTGTIVGDTIEGRAVAKVFGELGGVIIGSVKPNLGHSEGASGLSSIIKMVLALENQTIPPNIHFTTPNPKIPFGPARLRVPVECESWPTGKALRVGVLLESATSFTGTDRKLPEANSSQLLVFSATHPRTLNRSITNTLEYVSTNPVQAADASYTLGCRRKRFSHRAFAIGSDSNWDVSAVQRSGKAPDLVWVFTGQGAQYPGMGKDLLRESSTARETIKALDVVLNEVDPERSWTIEEELRQPESSSQLSKAEYSQPCCTALQIALVDVLNSLNLKPSAVVGHSAGEIAAAYAAGGLSASEAIIIAYHRGKVARQAEGTGKGGMMAVSLGREQTSRFLVDGIAIACENSPRSVTLSGDSASLDVVAAEIRANHPDAVTKRLPVQCAYHSAQMGSVAADYRGRLGSLAIPDRPLSTQFVSSVTGKPVNSAGEFAPNYWCHNLTSPVLFHSAITEILSLGLSNPLFLEVGPHSALSGFLSDVGQGQRTQAIPYIPTLVRDYNSYESVLRTAGRLFQFGASIDLSTLCGGATLPDLPPYQWQYDATYWSESRVSRNWRFREHPNHDILGSKIPDGNDKEPIWRSLIYLDNVPWLRDHVVDGRIIFPRAGYISVVAEAICQLSGSTDLSMRNVHFLAELELFEKNPTELMTQLRPSKLSGTLDSEWYDFAITSFFDGSWTKHCTGQVRGGKHFSSETTYPRLGARKVQPTVWQRAVKRLGVSYGPRFRLLQDVSASVTASEAAGTVIDSRERRESSYTLHPCTVDSIFQLLTVAKSQGLARLCKHQIMPTYIGEVYIKSVSGPVASRAIINTDSAGANMGSVTAFCGQQRPVISMRQIQLAPLDIGQSSRADPHAGARLVWKPDIDEVNIASLIRPIPGISSSIVLLEELALACMIETHHQTRGIIPPLAHAAKFFEWLAIQRQLAEDGIYEHVPACQTIASISSIERTSYIDSLYQKTLETEARDMATAVTRIFRHSTGLFQCQVDPLSLLLKDNLLTGIYGFGQLCDFADFFRVLAHNRPSMRILEIGAGTGGVTATILPAMCSPNGERMYDSYTYTDISSGFFDAAQKRFSEYSGIIYRPLDITINPLERGFEASSYDLIIASNVLHATPCLQETLANVKTLLKPDGKLFLQELAPTTKWINFIMGTLPGWWLGAADDRKWEPYVSPERWDRELKNAGFSGADSVVHDGHMNAHIISSVQKPPTSVDRRVTVLCEEISSVVDQFVSCLHNRGFSADVRRLTEERPADQMIISLLELDVPQLDSPIPDTYLHLRSLLTSLDSTPMLWVTKPSQVKCADPRYASTLGLLRTARREVAATVATIEVDSLDLGAFNAAVTVAERLLLNTSSQPSLDPVSEYAYADGNLLVGKFYPFIIFDELLDKGVYDDSAAVALEYGVSEDIKTFSWKTLPSTAPAFVDWVEVEVRAVGLDNDESFKNTSVPRECSGVVLRAGPGVRNLRVGDQIIALTIGPIGTRFVTSEKLCVRMARGLSWVEAATMPSASVTALYSLIDVARLTHGDTVLIHSACTQVGLAAIQICRIIGAQTFCSVESERETNHLLQLGVSKERIMSCRDSSFLQYVLAATNGAGVDVVLNSLSGELLRASWECVAEFGTLVELGNQNRVNQGQLAINPVGTNRTFAAVDIVKLIEKRPAIIQGLLRRCMHHYALGELSPLLAEQFLAQNVQDALECVQQKTHIGSVAIVMPDDTSALPMTLDRRTPKFRSDASHIIIGGLGGLGRSVSSWMSLHGARHFVFFSPSAGSKEEDDYIRELRAQGCRVDLVSGDVSNAEQVDALISSLNQSIPVAGVMQASMALEVAALADMSFDQWQKTFAPKVQGTWNLHSSLQKHSRTVDYFVLFGSLAGLIGQTGHANYAAGNSFLDAFVQYRHSLGLACSAVNIGVMDDVGYVSNQAEALEHFAATSAHMLHEEDLLDTIQVSIDNSLPDSATTNEERSWPSYVSQGQICIGLRSTTALNSPTNRTSWRRDPRMALYHNFKKTDANSALGGQDAKNDDTLERFLAQVKLKPEILQEQESADLLGREIGKALFNLMLREHTELDIDVPLSSLGADSLLAIKLRDWCRRTAKVDITVVDIIGSASLRKLGRTAAVKMAAKLASS
ncbi:polyketide synthase [Aspergillus ustus]|uniref:Polyketide synthase n=1 Tax=Aspergillus ustus TaxID=40382 RepID=A0A0C1E618_ASPUT|nr:polyketide synthase [Aspergillus ustus]